MKKRIVTGAVLFAVLLPPAIIPGKICETLFAILVVFIAVVGAYEYLNGAYENGCTALKTLRFAVPVMTGIIALFCCFGAREVGSGKYEYFILPLLVYLESSMIIMLIAIFTENSTATDIGHCLLTLTYCGLLLGCAFGLRYFEIENDLFAFTGWRSFIYVYTTVVATDTFAYLIGRKWGKKRLAPSVSPRKTVEGAIAGLIAGAIIGVAFIYIYGIAKGHPKAMIPIGISIGAVLAIAAQIGDLIESKLKRSFGLKDFGKILPGHGGILDRFDSFIYAGSLFGIIAMLTEMGL